MVSNNNVACTAAKLDAWEKLKVEVTNGANFWTPLGRHFHILEIFSVIYCSSLEQKFSLKLTWFKAKVLIVVVVILIKYYIYASPVLWFLKGYFRSKPTF